MEKGVGKDTPTQRDWSRLSLDVHSLDQEPLLENPPQVTGSIPEFYIAEVLISSGYYALLSILSEYLAEFMTKTMAKITVHLLFALMSLSSVASIFIPLVRHWLMILSLITAALGFLGVIIDGSLWFLIVALGFVFVGLGIFNPVSSTIVKDLGIGHGAGYAAFYAAVQLGSVFSMVIAPLLSSKLFILVLHLLGTAILLRFRLPHTRRKISWEPETAIVLTALSPIILFWTLYSQNVTAFVFLAQDLDLKIWGITVDPGQTTALDPFFVLLMVPFIAKLKKPSIRARIAIGMIVTSLSFVVAGMIPAESSILAVVPAWALLSLGEVLVVVNGMSLISKIKDPFIAFAFWWSFIGIGNLITVVISTISLDRLASFLLFSCILLLDTGLFWILSKNPSISLSSSDESPID